MGSRALVRIPDVTLGTAESVQRILMKAGIPVSRNRLLELLAEAGRTTTRQRLNRVLEFFFSLELVIEGSKGIQWTFTGSPSLRRARATGRRL